MNSTSKQAITAMSQALTSMQWAAAVLQIPENCEFQENITALETAIASVTSRECSTMRSLHIEGRRWFQRSNGNTYNSVRIWINGELAVLLPFQYGYGEQFLQTALDWLRANGHIPDTCTRCGIERSSHNDRQCKAGYFAPAYGTLYLREILGGTYSVIDVGRKSDL